MSRSFAFFRKHKTFLLSIGFLVVFAVTVSYATPPGSPYAPGDTLDPSCAPGDSNCYVALPSGDFSGVITDGTLSGSGTISDPLSVTAFEDDGVDVLSVNTVTTVVLPHAPTYANGAAGVGATLTGSSNGSLGTLASLLTQTGYRVLVKNQANTIQNGIYVVTQEGSASTPYILTRSTDSDTSDGFTDQIAVASEGGQKGKLWAQQTNEPTVGTSAITYIQTTTVYVAQQGTGTQVTGQVPFYDAVAKQISKGVAGFSYDTTNNQLDVAGLLLQNDTSSTTSLGATSKVLSVDSNGVVGLYDAPTGGALLQTDGTNNGSQSKLNLLAGTNVTLADDGTGSVTINASGGGGSSPWDIVTGGINYAGGDVGIGTTTPQASLDVEGDGTILAMQTDDSSDGIPDLGAGTRLTWDPSDGAFRAGTVDSTEWDSENVGTDSVAMGYGTRAQGDEGTAFGTYSDAYGNNSTALGEASTAQGTASIAGGQGANATGSYAIALGDNANADGYNSAAFGYTTYAEGNNSTAFGYYTSALSFDATSIGTYNVDGGSDPTNWVPTDPLFEVGNGTSYQNLSDALEVLKNGDTTINGLSSSTTDLTIANVPGQVTVTQVPDPDATLGYEYGIGEDAPSRYYVYAYKTVQGQTVYSTDAAQSPPGVFVGTGSCSGDGCGEGGSPGYANQVTWTAVPGATGYRIVYDGGTSNGLSYDVTTNSLLDDGCGIVCPAGDGIVTPNEVTLSAPVTYFGNNINGGLNVSDGILVNGAATTSNSGLAAPTSPVATADESGDGDFTDDSSAIIYHIYSYKTVDGSPEYSATYTTVTGPDDESGNTYSINLSWTAVSGADGYRIVRSNKFGAFAGGGFGADTTTNTIVDDDNVIGGQAPHFDSGSATTVTPIDTSDGISTTTFGNSINGGLNTDGLKVTGDSSFGDASANASSVDSAAFGRFNVGGGDNANWVATDPLFEIGNGTGSGATADALEVLKNGDLTVNGVDSTTTSGGPLAAPTNATATADFGGDGDYAGNYSTWVYHIYSYKSDGSGGRLYSPTYATVDGPDDESGNNYSIDLSWDAVSGATGYRVLKGNGTTFADGNDTTTNSITDDDCDGDSGECFQYNADTTVTPVDTTMGTTTTVFGNNIFGGLNVGDGITVTGTGTSGSAAVPLAAPTNPTATADESGDGDYNTDDSSTYIYRIYSYAVVDGTTEYSPTYATVDSPDDESGNNYSIDLSWDAVSGATGYRVLKGNGTTFADGNDTTTTTITDDDCDGDSGECFQFNTDTTVTPVDTGSATPATYSSTLTGGLTLDNINVSGALSVPGTGTSMGGALAAPTNPASTADESGDGDYTDDSSNVSYRIYAYKSDGSVGRLYSPTYATVTGPDDESGNNYSIDLSWDAVSGAVGYRVLRSINNFVSFRGADVTTNSLVDDDGNHVGALFSNASQAKSVTPVDTTAPTTTYTNTNSINGILDINGNDAFDGNGNLGIGTLTPSTALDVNGTITGKGLNITGTGSGGIPTPTGVAASIDYASANGGYVADGNTYTYTVYAAEKIDGAPEVSLGAPVTITDNDSESNQVAVTVSWNAVPGASGYRISKTDTDDGSAEYSAFVIGGSTSVVDDGTSSTFTPGSIPFTSDPQSYTNTNTIDGDTTFNGNVDIEGTLTCGGVSCGGGGGIDLQTDGTDNGSQALLNLEDGNGITVSDDGSGNVSIAFTNELNGGSASGLDSIAFGYGTNASGIYSNAFGRGTDASSDDSTAFGDGTTASGTDSTAFGDGSSASGDDSTAFGANTTTASGDFSTAFGYATTASGYGATTFGSVTTAIGNVSTAFGYNTHADASFSTAIGTNNIGGGNQGSTWVATDPLFEVGNGGDGTGDGTNPSNVNSDALMILKNGDTGIDLSPSSPDPSYALQVGSSAVTGIVARFQNSSGTCDVNPTNASLSCSSDMTLKDNIANLSDGSDWTFNANITPANQTIFAKLMALNPVNYNWDTESNPTDDPALKHVGFIAQEVQEVFPDLVSTDPTTHLLSLNYTGLVPYTVEALQEMNLNVTSIDDLTKDNSWRDALENWFADSANGITDFFSSTVTTNHLCVGTTCVTQQQFLQMVNNSGGSSGGSSTTVTSSGSSGDDSSGTTDDNSDDTQSPSVTPPTVVAPVVTPTPDPTVTSTPDTTAPTITPAPTDSDDSDSTDATPPATPPDSTQTPSS